jgi:hypothetical protein
MVRAGAQHAMGRILQRPTAACMIKAKVALPKAPSGPVSSQACAADPAPGLPHARSGPFG